VGDEDTRRRLAQVIVEALEVGTKKHERDVVEELFSAFGARCSGAGRRLVATWAGREDEETAGRRRL
jgi:hypothetical protein